MKERPHIAVTISRQLGSGGSYIGYLVAKELGFNYVDREILDRAAKHLGTDVGMLEHLDERSSGIIQDIIRGFSCGTTEAAYIPPLIQPVYSKDLFTLECKIMNEIVAWHSAVIIGRAGFYALRKHPSLIRIFIHAPQEIRIKRVMEVQNITDVRIARAEAEKSDRRRAKFVQDMAGVIWTDARNYHLCIDSSTAGFPACAEMIIGLVAKMSS